MSARIAERHFRQRALDLFCGAGGAAVGIFLAGYEVEGVDVRPQPHYPYPFRQADALEVDLDGYDLVWASPPCQHYCMYSRNLGTSDRHPDLVAAVRERLERSSARAWVIENVPGAPLRNATVLCGTMFGLQLIRHRLFETSHVLARLTPPCRHTGDEIPVYGNGTPEWHRRRRGNVRVAEQRAAMGIDWMTRDELKLAIPPAYSEWIARSLRSSAEVSRAS